MPIIKVINNEPFDLILRKFKRACEKAGIFTEIKNRVFYVKPTIKRQKAKSAALKKYSLKLKNLKKKKYKKKKILLYKV